MRRGVLGAVGLSLVLLGACASPDPGTEQPPTAPTAPTATKPVSASEPTEGPSVLDRVGGWFAARGLDLADVASVRVGVGPGLLANARVTRFVAVGAGRLGPAITNLFGFYAPCFQFGSWRREVGLWTERRVELGISTLYSIDVDPGLRAGNRVTFGADMRETFDVGAELYFALVGLAAEVRPDQAIDFAVGLFGFDPAGDDPP